MKRALWLLAAMAAVAIVLSRIADVMNAASEDANPAKHVRSLLVNTSGEAVTPLTDTQLRATAVPVSGTVTATGPLTDTQLRATAVPVSGAVTTSGTVTEASGAGIATNTAAKVCATALTTVTKATWTAIPAGGQTYFTLHAASVTSGNTATLTVWGSPDGGTTQRVLLRADTLAPARAVSIAVGTSAGPDTTTFADAFAVSRAGCTHIYIQQTAAGTDNYAYSVAGF